MCGLPPFVDEMIDVFIDEDIVFVGVPRLFTRPLRLTAPEGFALRRRRAGGDAAAGRRSRRPARPRAGTSWRPRSATTPSSSTCRSTTWRRPLVDRDSSTAAVGTASGCASRYWTASRDEVTERTITPRRVFNDRGDWYVSADDGRSGERRTFRIDRIESARAHGRASIPRRATSTPLRRAGDWFADAGRSAPGDAAPARRRARWVVERYPVDARQAERRRRRRRRDVPGGQRAVAGAAARAARARRRGARPGGVAATSAAERGGGALLDRATARRPRSRRGRARRGRPRR